MSTPYWLPWCGDGPTPFNTCQVTSLTRPPVYPTLPGPGVGEREGSTAPRAVGLQVPACLGVGVAAGARSASAQAPGVKVRTFGRCAVRSRRSPHPRRHSLTDSSASSLLQAEASEEAASAANEGRQPHQNRHACPRPDSRPEAAPPPARHFPPAPRPGRQWRRPAHLLKGDV